MIWTRLCFLLGALLAVAPAGGGTIRVPSELPLQGALDASAPGDTVLVAPGTYPKAVTVATAVLVMPDPDLPGPSPILAGVTGDAATFRGFVIDGSLEAGRGVVVEAGAGLTLDQCTVRDGVVGIEVTGSCTVTGSFSNLLNGIVVFEGATLEVTAEFTDCQTGVRAVAPVPPAGGDRAPAPDCASFAVEVSDCRFTGGTTAVEAEGAVRLRIRGSTVSGSANGVTLQAACAAIEDTDLDGAAVDAGVGLEVRRSYVRLAGSSITGFGVGVRVDDDDLPVHSAGVLGGSLADGNTLAGNGVDLALEQPEWLDADYNHWGTLECASLGITGGLMPAWIADTNLTLAVSCAVPAEPTTWGALKRRFGEAP